MYLVQVVVVGLLLSQKDDFMASMASKEDMLFIGGGFSPS